MYIINDKLKVTISVFFEEYWKPKIFTKSGVWLNLEDLGTLVSQRRGTIFRINDFGFEIIESLS